MHHIINKVTNDTIWEQVLSEDLQISYDLEFSNNGELFMAGSYEVVVRYIED